MKISSFLLLAALLQKPFAHGHDMKVLSSPHRRVQESNSEDFAGPPEMSEDEGVMTRVAVIGGGISGLTAAYELEKKGGYVVTVYEALDRVGGKMESVQLEFGSPTRGFINMTEELEEAAMAFCGLANYSDLGAGYSTPDSLPIILAEELGVPYGPATFEDKVTVSLGEQTLSLTMEEYMGVLIQQAFPDATQLEIGAMAMEQANNFATATGNFLEHIASPTMIGQADTDLAMSLPDFAALYGFSLYLEAARPIMTGYGYGYFETLPAATGMKFLAAFARSSSAFMAFPCGIQSLPDTIAATLGDVRLSAKVEEVKKLENGLLEVSAKDQPTQLYDRVIFSTTLDLIPSMMPSSLDDDVVELFSKLKTLRYVTTVFDQEGINTPNSLYFFAAAGYESNPGTISLLGLGQDVDGTAETGYQLMVDMNTPLSNVADQLAADMESYWGANVTEIIIQRDWTNYFPQVSPETFAAGFFDQVEALQGEDGVYYVGGQLLFETVGASMETAIDVVNRKF